MGYKRTISEVLLFKGEAQNIDGLSGFSSLRFYRSTCGLLLAVIQMGESFKEVLNKVIIVNSGNQVVKAELVEENLNLDKEYKVYFLDK